MRKINCELKFKKELSNIEICGIEYILNGMYEESMFDDSYILIEDGDGIFVPVCTSDYGLAYSSSSSYAMHNVTECIGAFGQQVSHFSITENNMLVMVTYDEDEDYYYYEIESLDY